MAPGSSTGTGTGTGSPENRRQLPSWRSVRAGYDRGAEGYDRRHGGGRVTRRFAVIDAPQLAIARSGRVLELGCGTGRLLAQAEASVRVGVDLSLAMLRRARTRSEVAGASHAGRAFDVLCADAHALPFADRSFDAILAGKGTFRYLDYERAFVECARILVPGGRLAVHQYAARTRSLRRPGHSRGHDAAALHVRHLDELFAPARRSGFAVAAAFLWRSISVPPYALPIPLWLGGDFWNHCVVILQRR